MSDSDALDRFEAVVLSQKPAEKPWSPTAAVPYDFESRKAAEGIHPQLIKDVFQPAHVLDVGCGYGHLLRLLKALDVDGVGLDVTRHHVAVVPWIVADITAAVDVSSWLPFDLVVCREVLEHLTVLQIRRAVTNLCALSSRFVYGTTRFLKHAINRNTLDVDTSDDLDPTHITMLHPDFLRALFVLEGFTRRADLEERMDHQKKGRCLVYERVA